MAKSSVPKTGARASSDKKKASKKFEGIPVITPPFQLSFPYLFEPRDSDFGDPKYSAVAVFTPTEKNWKDLAKRLVLPEFRAEMLEEWPRQWTDIRRAFRDCAVNDWGCDPKKWRTQMLEQERRVVLKDGSKPKIGQVGYGPDTWYFNATSLNPVDIIDKEGNEIGREHGNAKEIYAGAICRANITVMSYHVKNGTGITAFLNSIQKLGDGPRLDSRTSAKEDFKIGKEESKWLDDDGGDEDDADEEFEIDDNEDDEDDE